MLPEWMIFVAAGLNVIGGVGYIREVLRGRARPNRMTYFLWALAPLIAFAAAISDGVGLPALTVLMVGLMPLGVVIASFFNRKAYWKITAFDYVCGAVSVVGLVLWGVTSVPALAILFAIISDGAAGWPTVIKSYRHPETEAGIGYSMALLASSLTLLATPVHSFNASAFMIYILTINVLICWGIYRRRLLALVRR